MILLGSGCRLQTCRGLAAQWFNSTLRTKICTTHLASRTNTTWYLNRLELLCVVEVRCITLFIGLYPVLQHCHEGVRQYNRMIQ